MIKKTLIIIVSTVLFVTSLFVFFASKDYRDIIYSSTNQDISKVELNESAIEDICANIDRILMESKKYQISPKAIMGIIIAERSLHKSAANQFEEYYVRQIFMNKSDSYLRQLAVATKNKLENKKLVGESDKDFKFRLEHGLIWTIGLCQISIMKSIEIDSIISAEDHRKPRTIRENISCLMNPYCNLEYCAFELKSIRDKFIKEANLDISQNIGVLCTLYNTGRIDESIAKFRRTGKAPQPNDFGKFVELKTVILDDVLSKREVLSKRIP